MTTSIQPQSSFLDSNGQIKSGIAALRSYFGHKPGQTLDEFLLEVKALSLDARAELEHATAASLGWSLVK